MHVTSFAPALTFAHKPLSEGCERASAAGSVLLCGPGMGCCGTLLPAFREPFFELRESGASLLCSFYNLGTIADGYSFFDLEVLGQNSVRITEDVCPCRSDLLWCQPVDLTDEVLGCGRVKQVDQGDSRDAPVPWVAGDLVVGAERVSDQD